MANIYYFKIQSIDDNFSADITYSYCIQCLESRSKGYEAYFQCHSMFCMACKFILLFQSLNNYNFRVTSVYL